MAGADPAKTPSLQPQKSTQLSVGDAVVLDIARIVRRESTLRKERAERAIKTIYYEDADILVFAVEAGVGEKHLSHSVFPELFSHARHYRFVSRSYTAVPGLVVVAKHASAARILEGAVKMTFRALCAGPIPGARRGVQDPGGPGSAHGGPTD